MAKRTADEQITKDKLDAPENDSHRSNFSVADSKTLAKRKIIMPRGRQMKLKASDLHVQNTPRTLGSVPSSVSSLEKLLALNASFLSSIEKANSSNQTPNFTPLAEKYIEYASALVSPDAADGDESFDQQKSSNSSDVERSTAEKLLLGPKFSMSTIPTTSESPFKVFATPNVSKSNASPMTGPVFKFEKKIDDKVFKLGQVGNDKPSSVGQAAESTTQPSLFSSEVQSHKSVISPGLRDREPNDKSAVGSSSIQDFGDETTPDANAQAEGTVEDQKVNAGEENEEVRFCRRAKLMLYDASAKDTPYIDLGVGELKVLTHPDLTKSRVVIRADASFRVLLNVALLKDIDYTTFGNGSLVRIPSVGKDGTLQTHVVRVKDSSIGENLSNLLNELK